MKLRKGLATLFLFAVCIAHAQIGPPPPPPPGLPIDGGIFILALVGVYYGIKKIKR